MTTIPGYKRKSFHHPARVNLTFSDLALEDPTSTQTSVSVHLPSDQRRRSLYVETNIAGKHAAEKMFLFEDVSEGIYEGIMTPLHFQPLEKMTRTPTVTKML